jgi:zinc transporter 12
MAKGGPLGIGMGIGATVPNLPPPALPAQHKVSHSENSNKSSVNGSSSSSKMWIDSGPAPSSSLHSCRDGNVTPTESNGSKEKETDANKDANKVPFGKEGSLKHRILTRSPDDLTATISPKVSKSISFAEFNGSHSHNHSSSISNGRSHHHSERSTSNSHSQMNGHHHQQHAHPHYPSVVTTSVSGVLVDSNNAKYGNTNNGKHSVSNNNNNPFLPPSPKKRSAPWNFAVPPTKIDLPPPQTVASHSSSIVNCGESKYLSQNHKPSNQNSNPNSPYLSPSTAQQQSNPNSPLAKINGDSTTANSSGKSLNSTKENGKTKGNGNKDRNSSSSSSNSDSSPAVPVEAMPVLNAFKRGSLIQLANGELRPVEDLQTDDFLQAAAITSEATKIIHCTVLSIAESESQLCKVTLTMGSLKQQVVMESSPEQPFFVLGRGWSPSSPQTTQKLLQLPCTPLAVGDVCITLSRVKNGLKNSNQLPPKSPSVKTKGGNGGGGLSKGRNGSTASSNTAKSSRLSANNNNSSPTAATANKLSRKAAMNNIGNGKSSSVSVTLSNGGNLSSAMLPPPSPLSLTALKSSMNNSLPLGAADENERPPSPKKRRWSAPVDNVPENETDKDNIMAKKENPNVRIKTEIVLN